MLRSLLLTILIAVASSLRAEGAAALSITEGTNGEQTTDISSWWHSITSADGLLGITAFGFFESHDGQMWIATSNGLNLYNGQRMVIYSLREDEHERNNVKDVCETADHSVYAITAHGLFRMKAGEKNFVHIYDEIVKPTRAAVVGNTLYVGDNNGMHILRDGCKVGMVKVSDVPNYVDSQVRDIRLCQDGTLLLLSRYYFSRYDPRSGRVVKKYDVASQLPPKTNLGQVAQWKHKIYFTSLMLGLYRYDLKTGRVSHVDAVGAVPHVMKMDSHGRLYLGTNGNGAYVYDCESDRVVEHLHKDATGRSKIAYNQVNCFIRDSKGVDWMAFSKNGVAHSWHNNGFFKPYQTGDFTTQGLFVRCFLRHGSHVLIGTDDGLYVSDEATGKTTHIPGSKLDGGDNITRLAAAHGKYFVGTSESGLHVLDVRTLSEDRSYRSQYELTNSTVCDIRDAPDGQVWVSTSSGMFVFDADGKRKFYTSENSGMTGYSSAHMLFDNKGNGWLGMDRGFCLWLKDKAMFMSTNFPADFPNKLSLSCYRGNGETIYMSSNLRLFRTTSSMGNIVEMPVPRVVLDELCYYLVADKTGHLWMATEKGLFRMDSRMENFAHFGPGDGLSSTNCAQIDIDVHGGVWVATADGLMRSSGLKGLAAWERKGDYRVMLYNVRRGSRLCGMSEESKLNLDRSIYLGWNVVSSPLSFMATLADYSKPDQRYYEYRVDGGPWQIAAEKGESTLTGLFLGRHTLDVRLVGKQGSTNTYYIYVAPSWLAIVELLAIIVAAMLFVFWRRYRKNTNVMLEEKDEMEKALVELGDEQQQTEQHEEERKYKGMKLDEKECEEIVAQMRHYLETEHAYRNPDLKRADIAQALHVPPAKLSQIFTLYLKENYYDFINRYRLTEFKQMIADGESQRYTITALSEKCGFKRSNFFSTFRKVEGMTPAEYLRERVRS